MDTQQLSKRKWNPTKHVDDDTEDSLHYQPTSRDASDEDNTDSSVVPTAPSNPALQSTSSQPRLKRTRTDDMLDNSLGIPASAYSFHINPPPTDRQVRIYCDGIYDLFHLGHARALEQAKKAFPDTYLIVGVCNDHETHRRKGKTVMTDHERYESVRHCRWVDEVVEDAPWVITQEFLDAHAIDYVAHDDIPYKSVDSDDVYAFVKSQGRFYPTRRTEGVSTSDLITRIVRDYDAYLRRNIERGVTAKELNISFLKEQEIKAKKSILDIKDQIRQNWLETLSFWDEKSQQFVRDFAALFGAESVVDKFFKKRKNKAIGGSSPGISSNDEEYNNLRSDGDESFNNDDDAKSIKSS